MTASVIPSARERILAGHRRTARALPGGQASWLVRARKEALEAFAQAGFPSTRDEAWKYTSVAALERHPFAVAPPDQAAGLAEEVAALTLGEAEDHRLVFVDGRYVPGLSSPGTLPAGVTLGSLGDALAHAPAPLETYLVQSQRQTVFGHLNTAFMSDGAYLHLARGVAVEAPIHLLFIATAPSAALHLRNLIVAEAGASATVIEHYAGRQGAAYLTNAVTQVFAAEEASIEHCKLQQEALDGWHIGALHAAQGRGSRFTSHSMAFGGALARTDITAEFAAEGCHATLNGLYVAGGRQHVDHHTRIDHAMPHGTSREYYRGVLDGRARGVFNGQVIVHPGAQRTDAAQLNHNLLLSEASEVDTRPQLEIYADDVKCTHGATVGQLDDTQLFYLRSRGMEEATARALLTYAFARDVIERIGFAPLREHLAHLLLARLPDSERIGELA